MARRRHAPEHLIKKLRHAEVAIAEGSMVAEAFRKIGVTEQTYNSIQPHNSLGCRPPARAAILPRRAGPDAYGTYLAASTDLEGEPDQCGDLKRSHG